MSSPPDGDAVTKVESSRNDSQAAPSQMSSTIADESQSYNTAVTSQSQGTTNVSQETPSGAGRIMSSTGQPTASQPTPAVSQEVPGTAESLVSSTVQESASQSQPSQLFSQVATSTSSADTDATMMPPPTPTGLSQGAGSGLARSSGRAIKPTLKIRDGGDESFSQRTASGSSSQGLFNGSQNYGFRNRKSSTQGSNGNARAPRLKLNLKGGHASRGKGDPTLAGVNKTLPYMQGYDRELDSSDDENNEGLAFEEQIILRMPEGHEATKVLGEWVRRREVGNDGKEVEVKFKDSRRALFKMGDKQFSSKLVDLPAIIESHKTLDNKQMFKIADISQMLLVTHQIREETEVTRGDGLDKIEGLTDDFIYDHGITPPMKWARKRRFRQRIHKRQIETVEKEVERLLAEDERAENVEYAMVDLAEADLSDSEEEGGARIRRGRGGEGSQTGSQVGTPSMAPDGASVMSDLEDEFSQLGEQDGSRMGMEDDDVDQELQRELEQEMLLQQQEDEEDDDEEGSTRNSMRGRSMSRATSEEEEDDEDEEDDLFDAGDEDEGAADGDAQEGVDGADDDDDDDDLDEEEQEQRIRETQLEAECKEIEAMVKRKSNEVEATVNTIIKQRNLQTLKKMQTELDMKKSQLLDLRQQRREGKEAAKAEAQAQAEEAAAAASIRASSSAAPNASSASNTAATVAPAAPTSAAAGGNQEGISSVPATKESSAPASRKPAAAAGDMEVDREAEGGPAEEDDDDDQDSDESDLFG